MRIQKRCSAISDPTQRGDCEIFATSCVEQSASNPSEYQLYTNKGPIKVDTLDNCLMISKEIARFYKPQTDSKAKPTEKIEAETTKDREEYSRCKELGKRTSPGHKKCMEIIDICLDESAPYSLPMKSSKVPAAKQSICLMMAPQIAALEYPSEIKSSPPMKETIPPEDKFIIDGETSFANRFYEAGFFPEISDEVVSKSIRLGFTSNGNPKGKQIRIKYTCRKISEDSYSIKYRIFHSDETPIGPESEITFLFSRGEIVGNLAFGVKLGRTGDFTSIESIEIVKL